MKVSNIGLISKKLTDLDEQFPVQDMLLQTGQLEQFSAGIYAFGHIPFLVKKKLDKIISDTLTKYGCSELSLPILQPENIWKKSGRLERYVSDDLMFRSLTKNGNFCLAPTAEEAIVEYANARLNSYKQLPVTYFQIGPKFRNEIRTRGYLLRGKAFDMMDAYSFGRDKKDLDVEYERMKKAYLEIFEKLGLEVQPVAADSGAIGGSKSEEFMCISSIGEDNILVDKKTGKAFNSELLERPDASQYLLENYGIQDVNSLNTKKAVELGHIFQLGDKYSKSMDAKYINVDGSSANFVMGCYGIGVSRTLAMIYEQNRIVENNKVCGVSLPISVAPYLIYIIPKLDDGKKTEQAENVYNKLSEMGISALFDDRKEVTIGAKMKDAKVVGCPYMAVFGNSLDNGYIELENTKTGEKEQVPADQFVNYFAKKL